MTFNHKALHATPVPPPDYAGVRVGEIIEVDGELYRIVVLVPTDHVCPKGLACRGAWEAIMMPAEIAYDA